MKPAAIIWFRQDFRLADNPALQAAIQFGGPVVPVFIHAPDEEMPWAPGGASRWWLHQSLRVLAADLAAAGSRLLLHRGPSLAALRQLVQETGAGAVFWNRRYEPAVIARDRQIKEALLEDGLVAESFNSALLHEPWANKNQSGRPFQVFTPFWKHCLTKLEPADPLPAPKQLQLPGPAQWPKSVALDELELEPKINWAGGLRAAWQPGAAGAEANLKRFLAEAFNDYSQDRDRPDLAGTSRLSPHLHFGEISPRQVWQRLAQRAARRGPAAAGWRESRFAAELGWREFAHHLLYHFPHTPAEPLRPEFKRFPWSDDAGSFQAWRQGRTGYPLVDAGLRELWATGWMHNRVRMITASFLVKDLLVPWTKGAAWFWDTLVDADLAQNTLGWQWTAGCGADAAPYFRIFNPVTQSEKFDPAGNYIRRWCPELAGLAAPWIHHPAAAPPAVLLAAGVELGRTYPVPIVNHSVVRKAALAAFARLKGPSGPSR